MKKVTCIALAVLMCLTLGGWAKSLKLPQRTSALDGVTITLEKVSAELKKNGSTVFLPSVRITNDSKEGVMEVNYELDCLDKKGNALRTFKRSYKRDDTAIAPGSSAADFESGFQQKLDGKAVAMSIRLTEVKTEKDISPIHMPQPGEPLYKALSDEKLANMEKAPPAKIVAGIDQMGYIREAVFTSKSDVKAVVELFAAIKISKETYTYFTDNYNYVVFTWKDGSETHISLNMKNLEFYGHSGAHYYELEDLDGFWRCVESFAKE